MFVCGKTVARARRPPEAPDKPLFLFNFFVSRQRRHYLAIGVAVKSTALSGLRRAATAICRWSAADLRLSAEIRVRLMRVSSAATMKARCAMSMLLTLLMIYFGLVVLWAAPRLYRLLRAQMRACWCAATPRQTATLSGTMPTRYKAASD
jgi:hypothetical protein